MAKNFSDKYLASLKPKDKPYKLREAKGFAIEVLPTGTKTFLFIYEALGKRKQVSLGTYPLTPLVDARKKYNDAVEAVYHGLPVAILPKPVVHVEFLVKDLIKVYLLNCKRTDSTQWYGVKESIFNNKLSGWHNREVSTITKREAVSLVEQERGNGEGAARNLFRTSHALFEYAIDREYIVVSPFQRMKKVLPSLKAVDRSRFLTTDEILVVWQGITNGGGTEATRNSMKLILVTAQRPGEVLGMHRREISGDWWTIPAERAKKGGRDHRVFLTSMAKELIGEGQGYIFPSPMKDSVSGHINRVSLAKRIEIAKDFGVPHWTPHDLRRTARTHMSRLRVPREHAEAVLNHAKGGMVKVYDQYEFDLEKQEALQAWEAELMKLVYQVTKAA